MDSTDLKIINILSEDGRISNAHIARELELSEGTIRRRIKNLIILYLVINQDHLNHLDHQKY